MKKYVSFVEKESDKSWLKIIYFEKLKVIAII